MKKAVVIRTPIVCTHRDDADFSGTLDPDHPDIQPIQKIVRSEVIENDVDFAIDNILESPKSSRAKTQPIDEDTLKLHLEMSTATSPIKEDTLKAAIAASKK